MKKSGRGKGMSHGGDYGTGQGQGSGAGNGQGQGQGFGDGGGGRGRNKGGSYGTGGLCICTKCGEKISHQQGIKCTTLKCPECGHTMIREEMVRDQT